MKELLILLGVMLLWITLNRWVLPWFGIPTCMSGGCAVDRGQSCGPGPWSSDSNGVTQPKGNEQ
jgi:hypothetical protein